MSQYVAVEVRRRVRKAFGDCCAYCKAAESLTVVTFEIEHIVPFARDGQSVFDNLCLACPACNRFKSDHTHGKLGNGNEVRLFHPQQDDWSEHFDWSIDGTFIVGLTDIGAATVDLLRMNRPQVIDVRSLWVDAGCHPPDCDYVDLSSTRWSSSRESSLFTMKRVLGHSVKHSSPSRVSITHCGP